MSFMPPNIQANLAEFKRMVATRWPISSNRGDPSAYDFDLSAQADGNPHDLDLSSIVPFGFGLIMIRFIGQAATEGNCWWFRRKGDTQTYNATWVFAPGTTVFRQTIWCFCNSDRIIEYLGSGWTSTYLVVAGYQP